MRAITRDTDLTDWTDQELAACRARLADNMHQRDRLRIKRFGRVDGDLDFTDLDDADAVSRHLDGLLIAEQARRAA